jgi:hypothetical protein
MANNKVYANFLMHGRTKGSRHGISTTKGYTPVGQKAKGRLVNGKYVYDDPSMMLGTTQMYNHVNWQQAANAARAEQEQYNRWYGKGTQKTSGIAKPGLDPDLSNGARYDPNLISTFSKGFNYTSTSPAYDATKRKAENDATRAKITSLASGGAGRGDAQQAALAQLRKQNQNNVAAKKKAQQAYDSAAKGAANNCQQQAAYQQQKDATRNRAREKVKAALERDSLSGKTHGHMNVDPSKSLVSNQWQRFGEEYRTRKMYGDSSVGHKTFAEEQADTTKKYLSQEKMKAKQPNAMQGDTRYTVKENAMKGDPRYTSNKQESAKAQAANKAFTNAFEESKKRNSRSDIGNAVADFKEEAKAKAKSLFKKKKKK